MMKPTISLCMIVKNEEKDLARCLESVKGLVDEMIIVDTGSSDGTKEIAKSFGAKVFDFEWCDDFSAARNESLKHATGDWILVLDADEFLLEEERAKIGDLTAKEGIDGFILTKKNYFGDSSLLGWKGKWFPSTKILLFRNGGGIKFEGAVHEMVEGTIKGKIEKTNIKVEHFIRNVEFKKKYYLELTLKKVRENPSAKAYTEAGLHYKDLNQFEEAIQMFEKAISFDGAGEKDLSYAHFCLGIVHYKKGDLEKAAESFEKAIETDKMNYEACNNLGAMYEKLGKLKEAKEIYLKSFEVNPRNAKGWYNLGVVCEKEGNPAGALKAYEKAIELNYFRKDELLRKVKKIKDFLGND